MPYIYQSCVCSALDVRYFFWLTLTSTYTPVGQHPIDILGLQLAAAGAFLWLGYKGRARLDP